MARRTREQPLSIMAKVVIKLAAAMGISMVTMILMAQILRNKYLTPVDLGWMTLRPILVRIIVELKLMARNLKS